MVEEEKSENNDLESAHIMDLSFTHLDLDDHYLSSSLKKTFLFKMSGASYFH